MEDALGVNVSAADQPRALCPSAATAAAAATHLGTLLFPCTQALYKPFTRLPAHLLHDASPDGPLAIIAAACGEHMKAKALKRIDWLAPNLRKEVRLAAAAEWVG